MVTTDNMVLFWRPEAYLSNWYHCKDRFKYNNIWFRNSEAMFMYIKAKTFGSTNIMERIAECQLPNVCKALGRQIPDFDSKVWEASREEAMFVACYSKFKNNPDILTKLRDTGDKILVEASPSDNVWGIGFGPNDPRALNTKNWTGMNLLGKCLMDIREVLK